ncbi:DinB family protein [Actinopolymorpha sp. B17G11]|uniref:DinB family protein n=1 Tax=Actinopolymorpha sp. B17G11 TaxID=3160861 RepID=UPI0032E37D81
MRTRVQVYVENDVAMAFDHGSAAWSFEVDVWGRCGQGPDEAKALGDLNSQLGKDADLVVAERVRGDERAFHRDHRPATDAERRATLAVLADSRRDVMALVRACPDAVLDWDDPHRALPSYASWRTVRQVAWHIVDTESRYYLPMTGLGYREPAGDLLAELELSAAHVRKAVETMPADLVRTTNGATWTSVKLLRRLAWHERGELAVMRAQARRAAKAPSTSLRRR